MESVIIYILLVLVSLISCFIGFYEEGVRGNIRHLENGREPNAGVALLPTIPVIPAFYCCVVYGLNRLQTGLGWYVISGWFCMLGVYWLYKIPSLNRELKKLNELRTKS